ncbi:hypothetical protein LTR36_000502 [Oleoguttula mirabilis]|uniref:Carrier domain-containing protein n=1 Tax=Oleoguttula mirabilis TaxID=1507867 RepID=A0AAV9JR98_9PEZI|nr:hypothetical protein LTR36_000502 [Oleoguttula mirabilis]
MSPDAAWISVPKTNDPAEGFEDISYGRLANAVNRAAAWLRTILGEDGSRVAAYLGPSDARYPVLILGATKAGYRLLLLSPHNTVETQLLLLAEGKCSHFLCAPESQATVGKVLSAGQDLNTHTQGPVVVPGISEIFSKTVVETVPYDKIFDEERRNPFVTLHTSGTTGTPKLVSLPHGYYAFEDLSRTPLFTDGHDVITSAPFEPGTRFFGPSPLWHAGGIFFGLLKPLLNELTTVLPPANVPITVDIVHSCLVHGRADATNLSPSLITDLISEPSYHAALQLLKAIISGSGPLSQISGDKLLRINENSYHFFGLTETDLMPLLKLVDPLRDWPYQHFHPLSGATFQPVTHGLHELIIKRVEGVPQPCFEIHPSIEVFHTGDLFVQHPTKAYLWKHEGRLDDVVALSSGHKINPTTFEARVASLPSVSGALVIGQGRRQTALLVELLDHDISEETLQQLWSSVDSANSMLPSYGRIARSLFGIASQAFERTPKGSVQRRETEAKLRNQILSMYSAAEGSSNVSAPLLIGDSAEDARKLVHEVHATILGDQTHPDADVFDSGMDSLKVAQVLRLLSDAIMQADGRLNPRAVVTPSLLYQNRTIARISEALHDHRSRTKSTISQPVTGLHTHEKLLEKHLSRLTSGGSHT